MIAAKNSEKNIKGGELHDLILEIELEAFTLLVSFPIRSFQDLWRGLRTIRTACQPNCRRQLRYNSAQKR